MLKTLRLCASCPAKINLALNIRGKKENGYHILSMVNQSVNLFDEVTVSFLKNPGIIISCTDKQIPCNEKNSAYKAARIFLKETNKKIGIRIKITKRIPTGAGLGGESTDAAGVILALNEALGTKLPIEKLMEIGAKVGADVPFCLRGGFATVEGTGEIVTNFTSSTPKFFTIVKPDISCSTVEMFTSYDKLGQFETFDPLVNLGINDFELVADQIEKLEEIKKILMDNGAAFANLSGSGSAIVGAFTSERYRNQAFEALGSQYGKTYKAEAINGINIRHI